MRIAAFLPLFLALSVSAAAQLAPSSQDGPAAAPTGPAAIPQPDADGVYPLGPGITAPTLLNAEPAAYPEGALEEDPPHIAIFAVIIGPDGAPTSIRDIFRNDSVYDPGAIAAIQKSKFMPGTLGDKPVPVLIHVRVPFFHLKPAIPSIQQHYATRMLGASQNLGRGPYQPDGLTQPRATYQPEAEFSEEARKKKIEGVVTISLLVTADGLPTDLKVVKSVGYGLDEKALEAVSRYRFNPATRDGSPVATRITVQVNFRLYR